MATLSLVGERCDMRPTGLSTPQLRSDNEHINDLRGHEWSPFGVGCGALAGGARGASTAERLGV
jgi:hypothetical protein